MKLYLCSNIFKPWLKDSLILKFNVFGLIGGEGDEFQFQLFRIIWLQMVFFIKSLVLILLSKMEELKGRIIMLWKLVFLC